jgi:hypothetical protein
MATTTPNYGWPVPTSTDLVKNGATAIEALGDAIDASIAELKGGTTGQVLSKTSNTDMDFTWVAQDDSNAIQNTIVDAKGDLIAATANDTPARLAVGNNGETLVADSSTSTGLRYQGHIEAGKNMAINGGMDIWQRGTSFNGSGGAFVYTSDRWALYLNSGTIAAAQETLIVPAGSQYALKFTSSATSQFSCYQAIETLNAVRYAGQTVTFSGQIAATASIPVTLQVAYSTSTDVGLGGSWTVVTATSGGTVTPSSTTYTQFTGVYAIPSTAKSLRIGWYTTGTFATGNSIYFGQSQFELGSVPTSFSRAGGTLQGELAACQRYCQRVASSPTAGSECFSMAFAVTSSTVRGVINLAVPMRTNPTVTASSGTNFFLTYINAGIGYYSTLTLVQGSPNTVCWAATLTAGSNTAGQAGGSDISATGTAGANSVILSAEL